MWGKMVEIHPPKNSWHIGFMFMLFLWISVNTFDYLEKYPKGGLKNESGILSIKNWKTRIPWFLLGMGETAFVHFTDVLKKSWFHFTKKNATVELNEANRIFEISIDGNIVFGKKDTDSERSKYAFRVLICLVFFIAYLIFLVLKRKNRKW